MTSGKIHYIVLSYKPSIPWRCMEYTLPMLLVLGKEKNHRPHTGECQNAPAFSFTDFAGDESMKEQEERN
jgi:hypothetical protein